MKPEKVNLNLSPENRRLFSLRQRGNRANPTKAEKRIMLLLDVLGERYIFEKGFFTEDRFFLVDFYLPAPRRICLEVDGPYHDGRLSYDFQRDCYIMRTRKINKILRISNDDAMKITAADLLQLID